MAEIRNFSKKKFRLICLASLLIACNIPINAQQNTWVYFADKDTTQFNAPEQFDSHALARRTKNGRLNLTFTDYPVNQNYIGKISKFGRIIYVSRWLNAALIKANDDKLGNISSLPFVKNVSLEQQVQVSNAEDHGAAVLNKEDKFVLSRQINIMQGEKFISNGICGKGVRIAIFDGGFSGVDKSDIFKQLFEQKQIVKTYDFIRKKEFVYGYMTHGTKVLSCLAGKYKGQSMGLATGAEYMLAITEIRPERHLEEHCWLEAMEWADQNGADIISSSLGYTSKLYSVNSMDGKSSIVAKAAGIAAEKGILVVNAMGNDGNDTWEIMGTPADVDSVLSVGGISPFTGIHIDFSSFGPTSDFRLKPNVCAPGIAVTWAKNGVTRSYGTSFSTPLIAGFAACIWQMKPSLTNMQVFRLMEQSGNLYPYFDYAHGYGIPQASYFTTHRNRDTANTFDLTVNDNMLNVQITDLNTKEGEPDDYLYYHIETPGKKLRYYAVIKVNKPDVLELSLDSLKEGEKYCFFYKNCFKEFKR